MEVNITRQEDIYDIYFQGYQLMFKKYTNVFLPIYYPSIFVVIQKQTNFMIFKEMISYLFFYLMICHTLRQYK